MRQNSSNNPIFQLILLLVATVMIVLGIIVFIPFVKKKSNTQVTAQGRTYVSQLEQKDISTVDAELRKRTMMTNTDGMGLWEKLNYYDTYIMGDSRCEVFLWCGLQTEHVFAEKSTTIKYIAERIDDIRGSQPGNLVLSFGMNDLGMYVYDPDNYWETALDYVEAFDGYIQMIKEASPDTRIYINSIIPVQPQAIEMQYRWALVDEWNAALEKYCSGTDVTYIDTAFIAYDYADLFDDDGIHFYADSAIRSWGEAILDAVEQNMYQ